MEGVDNQAMTFDEVSMEPSKSFVKALQELKNLRLQLNSAAEYCEKSYLHSEQKQKVLDNLKDYAVRALVNAIDHLGTVAYKLADVLEQQKSDVMTMDLKFSCLNQQLLMSQIYMDKEGLRQQQLSGFIPRHHKHYILPNSVNKKVHFSPHVQSGPRQNHFCVRSEPQPSAKTLSWHLASETTSTLIGNIHALSSGDHQTSVTSSDDAFHLVDLEENRWRRSSDSTSQQSRGGVQLEDSLERSKPLMAFQSFDNPRQEVVHTPVRSKSMLSAFFVKQKVPKLKAESVS